MKDISANSVKLGDAIISKRTSTKEIVRSVSVVLHLVNGEDEVYGSGDSVQLFTVETATDD